MPRPNKKLFISNTAVATASATIAAGGNSTQKLSQGFPTGDALLKDIQIRHSGNLNLSTSSAGSVITRGGLTNIRSLWLQTPQHGIIINGLDGLALHTVEYIRRGCRPVNTDISAATTGTPTFDYGISLDFRDREALRPDDTNLDMFRVSYMELQVNYGGGTDFISGGTYTTEVIQVLNLELYANADPGPVTGGEGPTWKPYLDVLKMPVNQTQTGFQIVLPYGGRLVKRYFIHQRNGSTFLELANTVVGVNDTDRLSFLVGGYAWANRIEWLALQKENVSALKLSGGIPTGLGVLGWSEKDAAGYVPAELLGLNSQNGASPQTEINVDVTSVSNGQLWIYTEALQPIPVDAQRPAAAAPGK